MSDLKSVIEEGFQQYAGAVLQSRALVDVRDCLKPSARQIFYCLYTDKFLPTKPFKKSLKAIGSIARMYIHGDSSAEGVLMRASQEFAMRYPLVEVEGNNGNLIMSGNWAATRYTASRLSKPCTYMFEDIDKNTIDDWRDNYDDTEQYPAVLPSKGFYNIVNGTMGIGIGMSSSIPSFNLTEVNKALVTLLWNPDATFDELYCAPDFPTGAILLNESEVKESLRNGTGAACKMRSVIDYHEKERCFVVKEIPYGVYTNTICEELNKILDSEENPGIDRFNDLTGIAPNIKIYLKKDANSAEVLTYLYKNTSLQSFYSINMTMLKDGRFPKVFGWKEALQEHLIHEKQVYINGYNFDLQKLRERVYILDGYIIACANIEEVISMIKSSRTKEEAATKLMAAYELSKVQVDAILKLTLNRIASLEVQKFIDEKEAKEKEIQIILNILNNETLLNKEIEKGFELVARQFGDSRRTQIMDVINSDSPEKLLYFTSNGRVYVNPPKDDTPIATIISGKPYFCVTKNGTVIRSSIVPKRAKYVFGITDDDSVIGVFEDVPENFLVILDEEKHFRCKEISSLNKIKTNLSLTNIKFAGITAEKVSKTNYKDSLI